MASVNLEEPLGYPAQPVFMCLSIRLSIPKNNILSLEEGTDMNILNKNSEKEINITYRLSQEDMIVLNNIVNLSLIIIFFSVAIIIQGILISFTSVLNNPTVFFILIQGTLILLYFSFLMEILTFYFVFELFIKEVKSSEYENLKIIGDIENFLKNNKKEQKRLVFDEISKTSIYQRFRNFMNIYSKK